MKVTTNIGTCNNSANNSTPNSKQSATTDRDTTSY